MKLRTLQEIAHARSGDKGNNVNIGLIANSPEHYTTIKSKITAAKVKNLFADVCQGEVERFELDNIGAVNFVLHSCLDGGATVSLRTDAQGKVFAARLLSLRV